MLLRSSSTPILGSLLSSAAATAAAAAAESPTITHHNHQPLSCNYSPISDKDPTPSGFRRTRSDGNIESLVSDHLDRSHRLPSTLRRPNPTLESIPSFSIYNNSTPTTAAAAEAEREELGDWNEENPSTIEGKGFNFIDTHDDDEMISVKSRRSPPPPLFLARGLGIDRLDSGYMNVCGGGNGGGDGGGFGDQRAVMEEGGKSDLELYYKRMMEEDSTNVLILRNYAQFLYKVGQQLWAGPTGVPRGKIAARSGREWCGDEDHRKPGNRTTVNVVTRMFYRIYLAKGDLRRAEEYYSRAILAEPGDGETLSQYAKVIWELHGDEEQASSYFKQAVQVAPQDSHVLAAYAGFLWETNEESDGIGDYGNSSVPYGCGSSLPSVTF